jgi:AraC-like DNA-binding protein
MIGQMCPAEEVSHHGTALGFEVYNPDYHLTSDAPLWAATHLHSDAGPPAVSIHAGVEVGVVLAGREEIQLDDCVIEGEPGDVWLCAMSEPHRYRVVEPGTVNLVLVFLPTFLGEETLGGRPWLTLFAVPPRRRPRVTDDRLRADLLSIARELQREVEQKAEGWQYAVRLNLLRLLFHLSRDWHYPGRTRTSAGRRAYGGSLSRIMPALALVYERAPHLVSRAEAARACGVGPSRFTMLFRETMGTAFQTFRGRVRLTFAARLLVTTSLSTETIAVRTGFSDASHLHRAFVHEYGCTPGQYRQQRRPPAGSEG